MSSGGVIEISAKYINNLLHLEAADNGPDGNSSKVASPEHALDSEYKGVGI
jgi:sensor histidine kinase YesM